MKLQAPATLEGSIDICSLAVDPPPPSSPFNLNDAHCMEVMPTTWKREGREKVPFQPSPYTPRMLVFATSDMDLD